MQIKTFKGTSNYELLKQIKQEMGDNAIILNTKTEEINGKKIYTIMAAKDIEDEKSEKPKEDIPYRESEDKWYREWLYFKEQIFSLIKDSLDIPSITSRQKAAIRHLEMEGVGEEVIMHLFMLLKRNGRPFWDILNSTIKIIPWNNINFTSNCHIFVGPHGVGKTSTILKLSLLYKRRFPDAKICLVNVDNYQGKGKLYLKHYADLSNFSYKEVRGFTDITALLGELSNYHYIFCDTPGLKRDNNLTNWLQDSPLNMIDDKNIHLLLSPSYSRQQIDFFLDRYQSTELTSLIFTKLDESCTYGSMVYAGFKTKIPISLFTIGPSLKDSLLQASYLDLWNLVFKHRLPKVNQN